ncbi:MAG: hypothetical protein V9E87_00135 [Gemmatimonadales bacterium]
MCRKITRFAVAGKCGGRAATGSSIWQRRPAARDCVRVGVQPSSEASAAAPRPVAPASRKWRRVISSRAR